MHNHTRLQCDLWPQRFSFPILSAWYGCDGGQIIFHFESHQLSSAQYEVFHRLVSATMWTSCVYCVVKFPAGTKRFVRQIQSGESAGKFRFWFFWHSTDPVVLLTIGFYHRKWVISLSSKFVPMLVWNTGEGIYNMRFLQWESVSDSSMDRKNFISQGNFPSRNNYMWQFLAEVTVGVCGACVRWCAPDWKANGDVFYSSRESRPAGRRVACLVSRLWQDGNPHRAGRER